MPARRLDAHVPLLATTVVGSYPQPEWLVDRALLRSRLVPRVAPSDIWRVPDAFLEEAQDDATLLAIRDMERAGIDIITDGEIRRESYSNRFALSLDGVDADNPAEVPTAPAATTLVPRVIGPIRRARPVEVRDGVPRAPTRTERPRSPCLARSPWRSRPRTNIYADEEEMALAFADAVNAEARDLFAAGVDVVQLDEPWLQARPEAARRYGVGRSTARWPGCRRTVLHVCFGYADVVASKPTGYSFLPQLADRVAGAISIEAAQPKLDLGVLRDLAGKTILLGVLDLGSPEVESAAEVAARIRAGLGSCRRRAPGRRAGLRDEIPFARHRLRQAEGAGRRRGHRAA